MVTSYHITTKEAWDQIQVCGLKPGPLVGHEYLVDELKHLNYPGQAVWCWCDIPQGIDLVGTILDRITAKDSAHLIIVKIDCPDDYYIMEKFPSPTGGTWSLCHTGSWSHSRKPELFYYHKNKPYRLIPRYVAPEYLSVAAEIPLVELLEAQVNKS